MSLAIVAPTVQGHDRTCVHWLRGESSCLRCYLRCGFVGACGGPQGLVVKAVANASKSPLGPHEQEHRRPRHLPGLWAVDAMQHGGRLPDVWAMLASRRYRKIRAGFVATCGFGLSRQ